MEMLGLIALIVSVGAASAAVTTTLAGRCTLGTKTAVAEFQRWMMMMGVYGWIAIQLLRDGI